MQVGTLSFSHPSFGVSVVFIYLFIKQKSRALEVRHQILLPRWVEKNGSRKWTGAQYYDAKWVKKAITRLVLVETLGGIAPPTKQFLHVFAKEAAGSKTDRTEYGAASASASSFVVHHTQQISMAAVAGDAENINQQAGAQ